MANLVRAAVAWILPGRGGALVHAAALVLDGRAFLLVGSEGAGKSTWAALGERGGGRVLTDDLAMLDAADGEMQALGAPFRSTHVADYGPGRWPLAAILFPRHGRPAATAPVASLIARAKIVANLPFVAEGAERDPRIGAVVERLCALPCAELTFDLDPSFVDVLREA